MGDNAAAVSGFRSRLVDSDADVRRAVRVLLVDHAQRVLLFRLRNPDTGVVFWLAPGGSVEDARAAARREVYEETGHAI
jgi:8-oxo-dGTP pyrophosphatase MutT (NUDIX family)